MLEKQVAGAYCLSSNSQGQKHCERKCLKPSASLHVWIFCVANLKDQSNLESCSKQIWMMKAYISKKEDR